MKQLVLLTLTLVLFACKTIEIDPPAPEFKYVNEISATQPSFLSIQTELALKPYLKEADQSLDKKFSGGEAPCEGIQYKYHFEREPLSFELKDKQVLCDIKGRFDLQLSYCPKCQDVFGEEMCLIPRVSASCGVGEPKRRVQISYASNIIITENFALKSQTKLKELRLIDPCKITVFQYNATPTIEKEVRAALVDLEKEIDKQIASAPLRSTMKEVWSSLQDSILVAPYGYFYLRPSSIGISDLSLKNDGQKAVFTTQLSAQPLFSTDLLNEPKNPLPQNTTRIAAPTNSTLYLRTIASYDSINQFLLRDFDTQQIQISANKQINIDKVQLLGPQGDRLVLQVAFSGTKTGDLYLVVSPFIDSNQHLKVKDVDFEFKTKSVLLHSAKWILDDKIKDKLQQKIDIDLSPMLMETKKAIEKQINIEVIKDVWLSGTIEELLVQQLLLTSDYLVIDLRLTGILKLKVD